jgi:hypothetical protein
MQAAILDIPATDFQQIATREEYSPPFSMPPQTNYFRCNELNARINTLLNECAWKGLDGICKMTFKDAIEMIRQETGRPVFITGGVIRDIMLGLKPKDVDLQLDIASENAAKALCDKLGFPYVKASAFTDGMIYVKFLPDDPNPDGFEGLEGTKYHDREINEFENSVNGFMYDVSERVIIDPFGVGINDNLERTFRIPPELDSWENKYKSAVRVFKMLGKGYRLVDEDKARFVSFFKENISTLKNSPCPEKNQTNYINYVYLAKIRGDQIDRTTGKVVVKGRNQNKLDKILTKMKEFDEEIWDEVMDTIEEAEIDLRVSKAVKELENKTLGIRKRHVMTSKDFIDWEVAARNASLTDTRERSRQYQERNRGRFKVEGGKRTKRRSKKSSTKKSKINKKRSSRRR